MYFDENWYYYYLEVLRRFQEKIRKKRPELWPELVSPP
jgi:hypothetical protein